MPEMCQVSDQMDVAVLHALRDICIETRPTPALSPDDVRAAVVPSVLSPAKLRASDRPAAIELVASGAAVLDWLVTDRCSLVEADLELDRNRVDPTALTIIIQPQRLRSGGLQL